MRRTTEVLGLVLILASCGERGVDWNAPENLLLRETSSKQDNGIRLAYWSLVDIEHYPEFIPGVDRLNILNITATSKTAQVAQRVIGRQSNAKVEWKFDRQNRIIDFTTLTSDLSFNDGHYEFEDAPDGKRCLVRTTFLVKEGEGMTQAVPIGVLAQGTHDAFLAAAKGVKNRATGK